MANYLALVQDLCRESGTLSASAITSVTGNTGRAEKMVYWVRKAWENIQNARRDWRWMYAEYTGSLVNGMARYNSASFAAISTGGRWGRWAEDDQHLLVMSLYDPAIGTTDEGTLTQIPYWKWYDKYGRGSHDAGRPIEWAISPTNELCFGPTPDDAYTIRHAYWKSPQTLSDNSDTPEMPSRWHDMIVLEAHRLLLIEAMSFNEAEKIQREVERACSDLAREQLPDITFGDSPIDAG